ncbi:aminodeoxychorismate lyase [Janibacter alkaliphilus]
MPGVVPDLPSYADPMPRPRVVALLAPEGPRLHDPQAPVVAADDAGLTRGDGCFDSALVIPVDAGGDDRQAGDDPGPTHQVVDLPGHLARLAASARALEIPAPDEAAWTELVATALRAWPEPGEATLRLTLTRGPESGGPPRAFVTLTERAAGRPQRGAAATTTRPVRAVTLSRGHPSDAFVDAPWLLGGVKTLSYAVNTAALREARRRGADDVIFTSTDGYALDAPTAGLLVVRDGAVLSTPTGGTGILASTSIGAILAAAEAEGRSARHELVQVADLLTADGVWLVASSRGPTPVGELDGRAVPVDDGLVADVARWAGF